MQRKAKFILHKVVESAQANAWYYAAVFAAFFLLAFLGYFGTLNIDTRQSRASYADNIDYITATFDMSVERVENALGVAAHQALHYAEAANIDGFRAYITARNAEKEENKLYSGMCAWLDNTFFPLDGGIESAGTKPEWVLAAMEAESGLTPLRQDANGNTVATLFCTIYDVSGTPIGLVAVDFYLDEIVSFIHARQETGYVVLMNEAFTILAHPKQEMVGSHPQQVETELVHVTELLAQDGKVTHFEYFDADSIKSLGYFRRISKGWYVGTVIPRSALYQTSNRAAAVMFPVAVALAILACVLIGFLQERNRKTKAAYANQALFLDNVNRELRTPMNAVVGMSELLQLNESLAPEIRTELSAMKRAGNALMAIVNDITDYVKINEKISPAASPYLLASVVNDVINIIKIRMEGKRLAFFVDLDSTIPNRLVGDEVRLRQVMVNLLGAAVQSSKEGCVGLQIAQKESEEDNFELVFSVTDTASNALEKDAENVSLGIVKQICEALGGGLKTETDEGRDGIRFVAVVRQKIESKEEPVAWVHAPEEKRVLIFEPQQEYANSVQRSLKNLGVESDIVNHSKVFEERLAATVYSHVFAASAVFDKAPSIIQSTGSGAALVALCALDEIPGEVGCRELEMPANVMSIANIMNLPADALCVGANEPSELGSFTAPEARVLIVDDILINLLVAEGMMTSYGMQVDVCENGIEAVEMVKANRYDIIFMDHMMPGMDGIETTKRIRSQPDAYFKNVPIIALTANATPGTEQIFFAAGMNDFVPKPIEVLRLNRVLKKWLPAQAIKPLEEK